MKLPFSGAIACLVVAGSCVAAVAVAADAAAAGVAAAVPSAAAAPGADVLDRPARLSELAGQRLITGIAHAGDALVAVGQRGHILRSADGGKSWKQVPAPVSSDLTAVAFADARLGLAVGHDGVVLATQDGGASWSKLLDGRQVNQLVLERMRAKAAAADAGDTDHKLLAEAERNAEAGPDKPFLDVLFVGPAEAFVVGAYNLILHTSDGGKSWEPWYDRTDNPDLLNLYALRQVRGALYIVGESGLLLKLDRGTGRFRALSSPYKGSFFGLVGTDAGVIAYGLRGSAYLSEDEGASWHAVDTGLVAGIVGGALRGQGGQGGQGGGDQQGSLLLVDQGGNVAVSGDGGHHFASLPVKPQLPVASMALAGNSIVLGGPRGLRVAGLPSQDK